MKRLMILVACALALIAGCAATPECDNHPFPIGIGDFSAMQADEAAGDRWFWCEYGLPKWAWEAVPLQNRLDRIVNLRDKGTYFQGLGTWVRVTNEEVKNQIVDMTKITREGKTKTPSFDDASKRAAIYKFIAWLYAAGIIVRSVNDPQMGIYTLDSTIADAATQPCIDRADGPNAGKPPGAEDASAGTGGDIIPPGTDPGTGVGATGDYP